MASERNILVYEGDDTPVIFTLKKDDVEIDLTGGTVEMIIKTDINKADNDTSTVTYSSAGGGAAITILNQTTNKGQCSVTVLNSDLQNKPNLRFRVRLTKTPEKRTYIYGRIDRVNV